MITIIFNIFFTTICPLTDANLQENCYRRLYVLTTDNLVFWFLLFITLDRYKIWHNLLILLRYNSNLHHKMSLNRRRRLVVLSFQIQILRFRHRHFWPQFASERMNNVSSIEIVLKFEILRTFNFEYDQSTSTFISWLASKTVSKACNDSANVVKMILSDNKIK